MATPETHSGSNSNSGFDRVSEAFRNLDDQISEIRERLDDRRQRVEREVRKRTEEVTDQVQTQFRKRSEQIEEQWKDTPVYRRLSQLAEDIEAEVDKRRAQVYDVFGIATKDEVNKIHKKLKVISKKLDQLSKTASTPEV